MYLLPCTRPILASNLPCMWCRVTPLNLLWPLQFAPMFSYIPAATTGVGSGAGEEPEEEAKAGGETMVRLFHLWLSSSGLSATKSCPLQRFCLQRYATPYPALYSGTRVKGFRV